MRLQRGGGSAAGAEPPPAPPRLNNPPCLRTLCAAPPEPEEEGVQELARHPALKHGMPISDSLRAFTGFVVAWDTRLRNPKWVIEHLARETLSGGGTRRASQFREDAGIDPRFRSKLQDYRGSGYDRGHLASAANHKSSQRAMDDTFVLSNTSPQVGRVAG